MVERMRSMGKVPTQQAGGISSREERVLGPREPQGEWGPGYLSPQAQCDGTAASQPGLQEDAIVCTPWGYTPSPAVTRTEPLAAMGCVPGLHPDREPLAFPP